MDQDLIIVDITGVSISVDTNFSAPALTLDINSTLAVEVKQLRYVQSTPSSTWTINHNFGFEPQVQVFNSGSQLVNANITHLSVNQTVVQFTVPTSGFARLM